MVCEAFCANEGAELRAAAFFVVCATTVIGARITNKTKTRKINVVIIPLEYRYPLRHVAFDAAPSTTVSGKNFWSAVACHRFATMEQIRQGAGSDAGKYSRRWRPLVVLTQQSQKRWEAAVLQKFSSQCTVHFLAFRTPSQKSPSPAATARAPNQTASVLSKCRARAQRALWHARGSLARPRQRLRRPAAATAAASPTPACLSRSTVAEIRAP